MTNINSFVNAVDNSFVNAIKKQENKTVTANGDRAYKSTGEAVLDFFYFSGAARNVSEDEIKAKFRAAINDNEDWAIRSLLYARDIREGLGERRLTRIVLGLLASEYPSVAKNIIAKIVDMGRWDDLLFMLDGDAEVRTAVFVAIDDALHSDNAGLVAKWMPRKGKEAARVRGYLRLTEKEWRKLLVSNTNVVETKMCAKDWKSIDYSTVPSVASGRYAKAFGRHDEEGYAAYIQSVKTGKVNEKTGKVEKINTEALYPYSVMTMPRDTAQIAWDNLKDFVGDHSFMPIIDVSGSMTVPASGSISCLQVAVSLGVYLAERNKSAYKNLGITFSSNPAWIKINQNDHILDRFRKVEQSNWQMSTDLDKAMQLILDTAVKNKVPQSDLPEFLIILSDMQFNAGSFGSKAASKRIVNSFKEAGYKAPNIIWWNLNSSYGTVPIGSNKEGMILASGFSPAIMKNILSGEVTPIKIMLNTIMNERYSWK
jgi:hypothetical protein